MHSFFNRFSHSQIPRRAAVLLVALAWSSLVFGGEMHDAAAAGDLERVKALLKENPALVFGKDNNGMTPLHWAALNGHKNMAELLVTNKADVNAKNNLGFTPLQDGELSGDKDVVEFLRQHGGRSTMATDSTIHDAARDGELEKIKVLLKDNPDLVFSKDENGATALLTAALGGHKDIAELLLANKADVNATNNYRMTPLHVSALKGYKDIAALLLANNAEVNAKDSDGDTALKLAASGGFTELVELLRQHGGNSAIAAFSIPAVRSQGERGDRTRALMIVDSNGQPMVSGSKAGAGFNYNMSMSLNSAFGGSMVPSYWCLGAEQVFQGKYDAGSGLVFDSDKDYRLTFKLLKDKGLVYMCGRGTVTTPDGKATRLGYDDTVSTWLPLLASKDTLQREAASQALGDLTRTVQEKDLVVPKLLAALDDDAFQVRRSAAEALGKLGDRRAIQALTARSDDKGEKDEWVRKVVAEALDRIGK